MSDNRCIIKTR